MTSSSKELGHLSGSAKVDEVGKNLAPTQPSAPSLLSVSPTPEAGWSVTLTWPTIYGGINFDGWHWTPPTVDGSAGEVFTTDGTGLTTWEPCVHQISFGTTGLTPNSLSSNQVTVGGVLNIAHGGTGATTASAAMTNLLPTQTGHAGESLTTDGAGNLYWIPAAGSGTVTSVDVQGGTTGLTTSGGPVIGAGVITLGGVLNVANGGTGITSFGTGVASALGNNVNAASGFVTYSGDLGSPATGNFSAGSFTWPTFNQNTTGTAEFATNLAGGADWEIPYQVEGGSTSYVTAGVTGQVLTATTGAAPSWGPNHLTLGTTEVALGNTYSALAGLTSVTVTTNPTSDLQLTTKQYVDARTGAIQNLGGAETTTDADTPLTGLYTLNGYALHEDSPVLVKDQTNPAENGLYYAHAGAWTYAPNATTWADYVGGVVYITEGDHAGSSWMQTAPAGGTLGVTAQSWVRISQIVPYEAGTGIDIYDNVISNTGVLSFDGSTTGLTPSGATTGDIVLGGTLAITNGGTGETDANEAFNALAPAQAGQNGKFLTTDGNDTSWATLPPGMVYPGAGLAVSTGTAWDTSITLGTGVSTALGVNTGSAGGIVLYDGALGTPTSGDFSSGVFTWPTFNQNTTGTANNVTGVVAIANGGTGQTSANAALNALLPSQTNTYVLTSDGTNTSFSPLVPAAVENNIPVQTGTGSLADSNKYFSDIITSNSNIWSANQTQSAITTGLLNTPTLPVVTAATTANITLANTQTIDGVALVAGNYVLVKNQTTTSQNGIYRVVAGVAPGGNWVRQAYVAGAWADVTTQTTYADLAENNGILFVQSGTTNKNFQFQIYFQTPAATLVSGTPVYVTQVLKVPTPSLWNRFVDPQNGNDTNNNGSSALPYATLTKALVGLSYPSTVTEASGGIDSSSVTWTSGMPNCVVQGQNIANDGGQSTMSGVMTFATGSTRNDFVNLSFSNATPFVFQSGAAMRNYFQGITLTGTVGSNWLGLNAGISNWITIDNIDFSNFLATSIVLPSFTNAFTFNLQNQTRGILRFTGTGAANTVINIMNCLEGYVWIPSTYLGNINWFGLGFDSELGSTAVQDGVIKTAGDLATILAWNTDSTYDGWYAINVNSPSAFALGAIFGKTTILGTTYTYWGRTFAQAPSTVYTKSGTIYGKATTGWGVIPVTTPVVG